MSVSAVVNWQVEARAGFRCEFCCMHQSLQGGRFHVEHICPTVCGGLTQPENLALACPGCNFRKSDRITAIDPESEALSRLFNPRTDTWHEHFRWNEYEIVGETATGRATIELLELNHPRRVRIRQAEA